MAHPHPEPAWPARLFFSPADNRLRAGWRLLLQFIAMLGLANVLGLPVLLLDLMGAPFAYELLVTEIAFFAAVLVTVLLARRFLDRRSISSLGFERRYALIDGLAGFGIAGIIMGAIYLVEWAAGWIEFELFAWHTQAPGEVALNLLIWLAIFIAGAWAEELLTRGYWLQNLAEGLNLPAGILLSSIGFGLLHWLNPNNSWRALILLMVAGLLLALGYVFTRQLWLPVGLHAGWNYFEGNVFGFPVSGLDTFRLIHHTGVGPEWLTGAAFGPEAGLIVLPAMVLGVGLMLIYVSWLRPSPA